LEEARRLLNPQEEFARSKKIVSLVILFFFSITVWFRHRSSEGSRSLRFLLLRLFVLQVDDAFAATLFLVNVLTPFAKDRLP
jgi:phosphoglycerol transferase MdoB-like AlkP superfamily enzyme